MMITILNKFKKDNKTRLPMIADLQRNALGRIVSGNVLRLANLA